MNTSNEKAMRLALEALESTHDVGCNKTDEAITSLRQAIAEAEKQSTQCVEPVAKQRPFTKQQRDSICMIYDIATGSTTINSLPHIAKIANQLLTEDVYAQPKQEQRSVSEHTGEPVKCAVCNNVHAILDADESKIIRNAKDGYPAGRTPKVLTLQERITALCVYAADWKRWCLEKENTTPYVPTGRQQRKPLTDEQIAEAVGWVAGRGCKPLPIELQIARAIEAAHGIKGEE